METIIHRVKSIVISKMQKIGSGYNRDIIIKRKEGEELRLNLSWDE